MNKFDLLFKNLSLRHDSNEQGRIFEILCCLYLKTRFLHVWHWSEKTPNLVSVPSDVNVKGTDTGVDFYAQDNSGAIWAIQAKVVARGKRLDKKRIDSFVADTFIRNINQRMVVTTAEKLSSNSNQYLKQIKCEVVMLDELRNTNIDWPESLPELPPSSSKRPPRLKTLDGERWLPFEIVRKYAQSLRLRSHQSWLIFCRKRKRRNDIPVNPSVTYKNKGWRGWGDFLGTGNQRSRKWRNFSKAHEYVLKLELKTEKEWRQFTKSSDRPSDIPTNPNTVYKGKGWISWTHWLRGEVKPQFRGFEEAREWARNAGIAGARAYRILAVENKLPKDIPRSPNTKYRDEWKGWGDFLGTGSESPAKSKNFVDFKRARDKVRCLKLNSCSEWRSLCKSGKIPTNIPCNPDRYYKNNGWKSWGDFLGTDRVASCNMEWLPFKKARSIARKLRLASRKEWRALRNLPEGVPRTPDEVYEEWNGWPDWLGYRFSRKRC